MAEGLRRFDTGIELCFKRAGVSSSASGLRRAYAEPPEEEPGMDAG